MPIQEIKSFTGLSDYEDRGIAGSFKFASNINVRKDVDSLTCNQALLDEGLHSSHSPSSSQSPSASLSASPSASPSPSSSASPSGAGSASSSVSVSVSLSPSATPSVSQSSSPSPSAAQPFVFNDLILWLVNASDGYTYGFGDKGYIYRRDKDGFWMQVFKDAGGRIKGACEKPSASKKTYLVWATDTTLNRKQLFGKDDWSDTNEKGTVQGDTWPKTNLQSVDWHTMAQVGGDVMIANGSFAAMAAYDDSYTNEALDVIPGNIIKTIVERSGRAVFGTYRASEPTKGINAAIDAESPMAQIGDEGEIFYANLQDSLAIKHFPGGGKCNPGGVTNKVNQVNFFDWQQDALSWIDKKSVGNLSLWGVYGAAAGKGGIYSYGRLNKNKLVTMNLEYQFDADEIGAISAINGLLIFSYRKGTSVGVKAVDPNNKATATYEGLDFHSPIKNPIDITPWKLVELYMKPLPQGCSVQFWYRLDKLGSFVQAYTADSQLSFSVANGKKAVFRLGAQGEIYEPRVVLVPHLNDTPEIYRARTTFR